MKIIIITYPVSPFRGSEYSVSWNYITEMSKYHELFVLYGTSGNGLGNVSELQEWLKNNELKNVHFINVQMPKNKLSSLLSGENSPKQLLLINNQLVTKLIKFFD